MNLSSIAAQLEAFAAEEWEKVKEGAIELEQEIVPVIETAFAEIVAEFGQLAVQTVMNLMVGEAAALTGGEKLNLTATTITDAAVQAGKAILAADVTALAKNAYIAVIGTAPPQ